MAALTVIDRTEDGATYPHTTAAPTSIKGECMVYYDVPGIWIDELRQHGDSYYIRLRYGPGFYPTLAAFEAAIPARDRHYETDLGMWRVAKRHAAQLPCFFPNFDSLACIPVVALHAPTPPVYRPDAVRMGLVVAGLLAVLITWRAGLPVAVANTGVVTEAAMLRMPAPILHVVRDTPQQLAKVAGAPNSDRPLLRISKPDDTVALGATLLRAQAVRDDHLVSIKQ